jgi:hypothetical protein
LYTVLLHALSQFAPPVSPFKPSASGPSLSVPAPGHSLTSTGKAGSHQERNGAPSLNNLKRDLVNLLGVLSYERSPEDKGAVLRVQDTVRESGGLYDVMNMTLLDEHNPCE